MSKRQFGIHLVLLLAIGYLIGVPQGVAQNTKSATSVCSDQRTVAVDGRTETVLACDDFTTDGQPGRWTASHGVSGSDVANGELQLVNRHEDQKPGEEQTTQIVYVLGDHSGDLTTEVKFDDFKPNVNSRFIIEVQASPGNAVDIGRWSAGGKQYLQFQVIGNSQSKVATQLPYDKDTGVLKAQFVAATAELHAYYKEKPEDQYAEMPGSPYKLEEFKKGPYLAVLYTHNFDNSGGPASVKVDWVKITGGPSNAAPKTGSQSRPQPKRPANFKPFHFRYSTEELQAQFSADEMRRAHAEMQHVERVNAKGPYRPTWVSLDSHKLPEWFKDAKFGMFIDWGLYSVSAYAPTGYPDWYLWRMIYGDTKDYHNKVWGPDFKRDDFIPLFTASEYKPEHIAEVAKAAGMKYVIPFAKHHDGFALWKSSYTFRNAAEMGPKRDLIQPLVDACRKEGLKFGFYFSLDEWEYPIIQQDGQLAVREWDTNPRFKVEDVPYSATEFDGMISGKIPVRNFYNDYINPEAVEFIDRYDPDVVWFDGDWVVNADDRNSREIVAYLYNHAQGRKEVAVNDRMGLTRSVPTAGQTAADKPHGDFYTSEYQYKPGENSEFQHYWEETNGLSSSFGYNWQESNDTVRSAKQVTQMLVDVVSAGGNLLLITNLTSDGKLDPLLADRLRTIGAWLKTNGEAIYATRPWTQFKQGDYIRFTQSKDHKYVYAIAYNWPGKSLTLNSVHAKPGSTIQLLGSSAPLQWRQNGDQLLIDLPQSSSQASESVWAFKIEQAPQGTKQ